MPTSFPGALDAFSNPTATTDVDDAGFEHDSQHGNANDAIEALQAEVGVTGSAVTTSLRYLINRVKETFTRDVANTRVYPLNYTTDHFIVGSNQLDDAGGTDRDKRMWFNKTKGAFRAGEVTGTQWDNASVGANSVALGNNVIASGAQAVALGLNGQATGLYSFVANEGNTASGSMASAFGSSGTASGSGSFVTGSGCTASGLNATALGQNCTVAGTAAVALGFSNTAPATAALATGYGSSASRLTQQSRAGLYLSSVGDAQANSFVASRISTSATPVVLLFDNGQLTSNTATLTGLTTNVLTVPVSRAHRFTITAVARRTDTPGTFASWKIEGTIVRSSSGDARFISTPTVSADKDAGASAWDLAVSINTSNGTNNYLVITATGEAGATIRWVADITTVEVG